MENITYQIAVMAHHEFLGYRITLQISWNEELAYQIWNLVGVDRNGTFCHFYDNQDDAVAEYNEQYIKMFGR